MVDSPEAVSRVATAIDEQFRNAPRPTKSESEHAFQLGFVAMLGNVKAFILSICLAVVFAILLVSATTMAMSVRERTREVAVLKTLGFTRKIILGLFVGESVALSLAGGVLGTGIAFLLVSGAAAQGGFLTGMKVTPGHYGGLPCWWRRWWDSSARLFRRIALRRPTSSTACGTSARETRRS